MSVDTMKIAVFALMIVVAVVSFFSWSAFLKVLKEDHPDGFRSIGKPSLLADKGIASDMSTFRFLYSSAYLELGNPRLNTLATRTKLCTLTIFGLMVALGYLDWVLG